jgi:ubiquinone/menaquinone biosynthesis C-methylase UbiE
MALAAAILHTYNFSGTLRQFVVSGYKKKLKVLEINEAGRLSPILQKLPDHRLVRFPEYDMANLAFESDTVDLIIHSDTLEHVPNPERALSECRRVLCGNGKCIFTVPIIVNRTTRSRAGLALSYHGRPGVPAEDQVVFTEFGADIWQTVLKAGFCTCEIFTLEYPSALAIIARK